MNIRKQIYYGNQHLILQSIYKKDKKQITIDMKSEEEGPKPNINQFLTPSLIIKEDTEMREYER